MNTEEHKEWYAVVKEAVKAELLSEGWTPPEDKWQPTEGELVECNTYADEWIPVRYSHTDHEPDRCRPHPTHIKWEEGKANEYGFTIGHIYRLEYDNLNSRKYACLNDGSWFWLEEEEA